MEDVKEMVLEAITGRPHSFEVSGRRFMLYPTTLGKMYLLQSLVEKLGVKAEILSSNTFLEMLRVVKMEKETCLTIITYHTMNNKEDIFDEGKVQERRDFFLKNLSEDEIATLMVAVLSSDKTDILMKELGIDKEQDMLRMVMRVKESKNTLTFGGKSQFGVLIDMACERYGWTKDYVVWGIDYTSLRLMLADKVTSTIVTDEERKKLPAVLKNKDEDIIRPTKENMKAIMDMDWS